MSRDNFDDMDVPINGKLPGHLWIYNASNSKPEDAAVTDDVGQHDALDE